MKKLIQRHPVLLSLIAVGFVFAGVFLYTHDLNRNTHESNVALAHADEFAEHMEAMDKMSVEQLKAEQERSEHRIRVLKREILIEDK